MAKTRLFADDCVIYRPIKTTKDCLQLQEDLHRLAEWEDKWGCVSIQKNAVSFELLEQDHQFCTPTHWKDRSYTQMNSQNTWELT